jgi:hypothetical protein
MDSLNFSTVIYQAAQLMGMDRDNVPEHEWYRIRDFSDLRLQLVWEIEPWPPIVRWTSASITSSGDKKYFDLPAGNDILLKVMSDDPAATTRATDIFYRYNDDGTNRRVYIYGDSSSVYYVTRIKRPDLTGAVYESTVAYDPGDQVLFTDSKGVANFYNCKVANSGQPPDDYPTSWSLVEIPKIFQSYLVRGVYADMLRAQGRDGDREDALAESQLIIEIDKVYRQQGLTPRIRI